MEVLKQEGTRVLGVWDCRCGERLEGVPTGKLGFDQRLKEVRE